MTHAIRIHETGGPEVLRWEEVEVGSPGPGQVRLRQTAVGLNFVDTYLRSGLYPLPHLPAALGMEAAGVVEEVGPEVAELRPGDRVAYATAPGAYCESRLIAAAQLIKLPAAISDQAAAAMMLKGMTVEYLLRRTYQVKAGDTILFHAAAGGVGLIACQWARRLGATVIGTVGSREKGELAKRHGCHQVILYREEGVAARVKELTAGRGVPVVYDSVGKDTFFASLDCLRPRGLMVSFGNASGPPPEIPVGLLNAKGSLYLTRPSLAHYTSTREELLACARALLEVVAEGAVKIEIRHTYPLSEAAQAHRDLEARRTTGSVVLLP